MLQLWLLLFYLAACIVVAAGAANSWTTGAVQQSRRASLVESFKVMDVLRRAGELEREGRSVIHLEVGQPQTGAPAAVLSAAAQALSDNRIGYTDATGIQALRERISQHYWDKYKVKVSPDTIVVTTGSSGAFLLAFLAAFDVGDRVAVASSSYPCYRHILNALGCTVVTIDINNEFKVTAKELLQRIEEDKANGEKPIKGIILSSPSNPTGAMLTPEELKGLCEVCKEKGVKFLSDEIYHGITFGKQDQTALKYSLEGDEGADDTGGYCMVINSFSKYYSMTGWRLGWMVVPQAAVGAVNRLAQNLFINAPTLSQLAAVQAFDCEEELEKHRQKYELNRSILLEQLALLGFDRVAPSDGAFYVYVDVSDLVEDSIEMAADLLESAGVAVTPGNDFECPLSGLGSKRIRFSFCGSTSDMREGMRRMAAWWSTYPKKKAT